MDPEVLVSHSIGLPRTCCSQVETTSSSGVLQSTASEGCNIALVVGKSNVLMA